MNINAQRSYASVAAAPDNDLSDGSVSSRSVNGGNGECRACYSDNPGVQDRHAVMMAFLTRLARDTDGALASAAGLGRQSASLQERLVYPV